MRLVDAAAARASCDRGRSGAVFVRDNDVLATGYVGAPPGQPDCFEVGHLMQTTLTLNEGSSYLGATQRDHCTRTIHAEQNAILRAARNGVSLRGSTLYCTMEPCVNCAMSLLALDVRRVVAGARYHAAGPTRVMLDSAGVRLEVLSEKQLY